MDKEHHHFEKQEVEPICPESLDSIVLTIIHGTKGNENKSLLAFRGEIVSSTLTTH